MAETRGLKKLGKKWLGKGSRPAYDQGIARTRTTPTKPEKMLARRTAAFTDDIKAQTKITQTLHKPGSLNYG